MIPDQIREALAHPLTLFLDPNQRLSIYYLGTALIVAIFAWWGLRRSDPGHTPPLLRWLFPRDVILHPSARADLWMFLINKSVILLIYGSVILQSYFWFTAVGRLMGPVATVPPSLGTTVVTTLVVVLATDFMLWLSHYLFHRVPVLWEFHKAHHSAEVMTPITAARMHPVDEIASSMMGGFGLGVSAGLMNQAFGQGGMVINIFGLNIITALFYIAAFNLRHSHVWVRYPVWMQHVLISPAQHQIHHSRERRHWDRNMGFIFGFWDWAAGTLYAPRRREVLDFGLGNGEDGTWNTMRALYFRPFRNAYMLLRQDWRTGLGLRPLRDTDQQVPDQRDDPIEPDQHKAL